MNYIEVLAPAGNKEALTAAVFAGADAVYMGGSLFSARANAVNFTLEDISEAVTFSHIRGVKVYVTVNTLLKDNEIAEAAEFIKFLCGIGVDGILVQDMGLFNIINTLAPDMPLHCSTQMSIHTPAAAKMMYELGADRVVLARELSLQEIEEIHGACPVELEAFVHGALCMSVSGQCYFSAMLGSRSGNRGRCAQTCRLPFSNKIGSINALSLKDMSFIDHIDKLAGAGVVSAKIEGRMKRPEYVAAAVSACRRAADGESVPQELSDNLEAVFSRSGFTDGYLTGNRKDMFGIRTKEDVTAGSSEVFSRLHEIYKGEAGRVPLEGEFTLFSGERAMLTLWDNLGNKARVYSDSKAETAINRPMDEDGCKLRMSKLGSTPYYLRSLSVKTDGKSILAASELNGMRRQCTEILSAKRGEIKKVSCNPFVKSTEPHVGGELKLRGVFRNLSQVPSNVKLLQYVYLPITEKNEDFTSLLQMGVKVGAEIPRSFFGGEEEVRARITELSHIGVNVFLCGNLGAVALCRELGVTAHGGFSLNITGTEAINYFGELGLAEAELSFELTLGECEKIGGKIPRGIMVYGRQALMLTRNCPLSSGGCINCGNSSAITDRKGINFPVMCHKGKTFSSVEVFNSVPLSLSDRINEVKNMDFGVLRFTVENNVETGEILQDFIRHEKPCCDYTRGLFYRGVI